MGTDENIRLHKYECKLQREKFTEKYKLQMVILVYLCNRSIIPCICAAHCDLDLDKYYIKQSLTYLDLSFNTFYTNLYPQIL